MPIDSHQHFWQWSKGWFSRPEPVLARDYLPADLEPIVKASGVNKTIVVQTSPTVEETDFLLELAADSDFVDGVVGWLDMDSPNFPALFEQYCQNPYFVALRPMLQCLPEDDWILRPRIMESLALIAERGFTFEFLTFTRHLPFVLKALERVPKLHAVIDHLSKPEIKAGKMQPWADLMRDIAQHPTLYCKLSGLVTEADYKNWTPEQLRPYADHVLEHFGAGRVMFGSDWPVCLLAASYEQVLAVARTFVLSRLGQSAEAAVFGKNAARFYRLKGRS